MSAVTILIRRLDDVRHRLEQQRKASRNPWFTTPLDEDALGTDITVRFDGEGLALAVLASTSQKVLVRYLYSAACMASTIPVSKEVILQILQEEAYSLKVDSRSRFRLPWDFDKTPADQIAEIEIFLSGIDSFWRQEMIQAGVVCREAGQLRLAPIFHVLAANL